MRHIQKPPRRDKEFGDLETAGTGARENGRANALSSSRHCRRAARLEAPRNGLLNEPDSVRQGLQRLRRQLESIRAAAGAAEPKPREALRRPAMTAEVRVLPGQP